VSQSIESGVAAMIRAAGMQKSRLVETRPSLNLHSLVLSHRCVEFKITKVDSSPIVEVEHEGEVKLLYLSRLNRVHRRMAELYDKEGWESPDRFTGVKVAVVGEPWRSWDWCIRFTLP